MFVFTSTSYFISNIFSRRCSYCLFYASWIIRNKDNLKKRKVLVYTQNEDKPSSFHPRHDFPYIKMNDKRRINKHKITRNEVNVWLWNSMYLCKQTFVWIHPSLSLSRFSLCNPTLRRERRNSRNLPRLIVSINAKTINFTKYGILSCFFKKNLFLFEKLKLLLSMSWFFCKIHGFFIYGYNSYRFSPFINK